MRTALQAGNSPAMAPVSIAVEWTLFCWKAAKKNVCPRTGPGGDRRKHEHRLGMLMSLLRLETEVNRYCNATAECHAVR
jgi:hypothetical protein